MVNLERMNMVSSLLNYIRALIHVKTRLECEPERWGGPRFTPEYLKLRSTFCVAFISAILGPTKAVTP